ncbi:MAG TPA: amidohydrolase family protein [Verrucomicrobiae bacterium]|nr:amidohydrolase family protein [Verrucomicrobiae bacterium]
MIAIASMKKINLLVILLVAFTARAERVLFRGATVHTVSGQTLAPGDVLVDGKKIVDVGPAIAVKDARMIDLKGQHLYPGLIAADTTLGLIEISGVAATRDSAEVGQFTPDVQSWIAVNPDSELIPVARANGITHAQPVPSGGIVSGLSGVIALAGWTTEEMTIRKPVALHLTWPNMNLDTRAREDLRDRSNWKSLEDQAKERRARLKDIDEFFAQAKAYARSRTDKSVIPAWEAMLPLVRGEIPLMIRADDARQIRAAVKWADTNGFYAVIVGGQEAAQAADLLAAKKIPVIFDSLFEFPSTDTDSYDKQFKTPAILHRAGVKVIFSEGGRFEASMVRNLPYNAAQAVAFGLPADEALKGITLYPAQVLGVDERLGSIDTGKEASLFVSDGDILDIRSKVQRVWIAGQEVSLATRHTRLYEKYRGRPASIPGESGKPSVSASR